MNSNNAKDYRTADLALTAALCVHGFVIEKLERVNPARSVFIFNESERLAKIIKKYWRGELRVEPQEYFDRLKIIKARIYER